MPHFNYFSRDRSGVEQMSYLYFSLTDSLNELNEAAPLSQRRGGGKGKGGGRGLNSLDNRERPQTDRFFSLLFPSVEKKRIKIKVENK